MKETAYRNIFSIDVTREVSHAPMSRLKADALWNIAYMSVTPEVSHAPMSSLKDDANRNNCDMDVTSDVSHVEMWPYVASADALFESHKFTAVVML